ncbi:MAG TPA: PQQ-dependent sugar dehydrogenase [Vicinamibacterales bacterium]|nr:PQQ-dependent sugar dehydrogenase [Vicinamibacterales bacterium]
MKTVRQLAIVLAVGIAASGAWLRAQQQPTPEREIGKLYGELCSNCHGPKLEGAQFGSLVDDVWKFGGTDADLTRMIQNGNPGGMPPFAAVLSPEEIRAMVIYIREQGARAAREKTTFNKPAANVVVTSEKATFRLETVAEGVTAPWGIDFLPDGRILVTEKAGTLRIVDKGKLLSEPVSGVPKVLDKGQGGLLDVAVHPDYAKNGWIYLSFSDPGPEGSAMTKIVRGKLKGNAFVDVQDIFKAPTELYLEGPNHFGDRIVFDRKGHIYFSIGDRFRHLDAQNTAKPNGKIHRVNEDGSIPKDNPFVGKPPAMPSIYSFGHRNPQGLTLNAATGVVWEVEHGPRGGDELNIIRAGHNYGWPLITYGMNYNGTPWEGAVTAKEGLDQPITYWTPSIAVSSLAFYTGDKFPQWKGQILLGSLAFQELRRLELTGEKVTHQEVLFKDVGRLRDMIVGPDGYVYIAFNQPDRIARLVPAPAGGSAN